MRAVKWDYSLVRYNEQGIGNCNVVNVQFAIKKIFQWLSGNMAFLIHNVASKFLRTSKKASNFLQGLDGTKRQRETYTN